MPETVEVHLVIDFKVLLVRLNLGSSLREKLVVDFKVLLREPIYACRNMPPHVNFIALIATFKLIYLLNC